MNTCRAEEILCHCNNQGLKEENMFGRSRFVTYVRCDFWDFSSNAYLKFAIDWSC